MNDVNYSCRHSRASGNPKALRYFCSKIPSQAGNDDVHVVSYKTVSCKKKSMVACPRTSLDA